MTKKNTKLGGMVILMIASSSLFYSCKKESTKPTATTTTTPATSTTPTNSTCPQENMVTADGIKSCKVTGSSMAGIYLTIQVYDANIATAANYQQIIFTVPLPIQKGVAVQLGGTGSSSWAATYGIGSTMYSTDATHLGTFTVTSYDATVNKISGTFSFTGFCNPSSDVKTISNGVFTDVTWQ